MCYMARFLLIGCLVGLFHGGVRGNEFHDAVSSGDWLSICALNADGEVDVNDGTFVAYQES